MKSTWKLLFCCCTTELWSVKSKTLLMCTDIAGLGLDFRVEGDCISLWVRIWEGKEDIAGHTTGDLYKVKRCLIALHVFKPAAARPSCHMIPFINVSDSCPCSGKSKRVTLLYSLSAAPHGNCVSLNTLPPYPIFTPSCTFQWAQSYALSIGFIYQAD